MIWNNRPITFWHTYASLTFALTRWKCEKKWRKSKEKDKFMCLVYEAIRCLLLFLLLLLLVSVSVQLFQRFNCFDCWLILFLCVLCPCGAMKATRDLKTNQPIVTRPTSMTLQKKKIVPRWQLFSFVLFDLITPSYPICVYNDCLVKMSSPFSALIY